MITAIILAGGLGTRLREVVSDRPKPMALISGKPFLEYLLDYWVNQGVSRFILSVGYKSSVIQEYFGFDYRGCEISYAIEPSPLGTGGGVLLSISQLKNMDEPFLLLNGDTFFAVELDKLVHFHKHTQSDCTFSLFRADEARRYMGIDINPSGKITALNAEKGNAGELANGGVYLINPSVIHRYYSDSSGQVLSLESDIFYQLLEHGENIYGLEFDSCFIDIGLPYDYARAPTIIGLDKV
ncbi:nucleotidyltransferase family protein [Vibrio sp. MEBiC08052]|uniref:nucleotidyltransferase family protein n=1 Tax=Vibrio sp. MEBiC08052 TaxID=1761910 RepID=UPI0007407510|nr:nucleotidyltransferase family protein [Vibrio sp. MEBiC08052]KUJ00644.1 hypothetical protein VRK_01460 [Vibrio sp. MEBiC08052]